MEPPRQEGAFGQSISTEDFKTARGRVGNFANKPGGGGGGEFKQRGATAGPGIAVESKESYLQPALDIVRSSLDVDPLGAVYPSAAPG